MNRETKDDMDPAFIEVDREEAVVKLRKMIEEANVAINKKPQHKLTFASHLILASILINAVLVYNAAGGWLLLGVLFNILSFGTMGFALGYTRGRVHSEQRTLQATVSAMQHTLAALEQEEYMNGQSKQESEIPKA
jgi:hypothetical protein